MASVLCTRIFAPIGMSGSSSMGGLHKGPLPSFTANTAKIKRSVYCTVCVKQTELAQGVPSSLTTLHYKNDKLDICRVVNGMWQTSGGWGKIDPPAAVEAMLRYVDAGLYTFDMADHYGPAEDLYGVFINRLRREQGEELAFHVKGLTKWVPPPVKMTRAYVEQNIDRSRKRMDVKTLDMLQFHWWEYSDHGYLDALKHLTDLKEEGKIKTLGLTNFDTKRLQIILENEIPIVSNQVQYSVVDIRPQKKMAEFCQFTGVKLITYGTVMGGLLSEKFLDANISVPFAGPPLNTPSLTKYKQMVDAWGGWSLFQELLRTLRKISLKHGVSIPAVAVRYVLDQMYLQILKRRFTDRQWTYANHSGRSLWISISSCTLGRFALGRAVWTLLCGESPQRRLLYLLWRAGLQCSC